MDAWALIANAHEGCWEQAVPGWQAAAVAWRDRWHAHLDEQRAGWPD